MPRLGDRFAFIRTPVLCTYSIPFLVHFPLILLCFIAGVDTSISIFQLRGDRNGLVYDAVSSNWPSFDYQCRLYIFYPVCTESKLQDVFPQCNKTAPPHPNHCRLRATVQPDMALRIPGRLKRYHCLPVHLLCVEFFARLLRIPLLLCQERKCSQVMERKAGISWPEENDDEFVWSNQENRIFIRFCDL